MSGYIKFLSLAITAALFSGCFETKKELACDDKNVQETIKKLIKPHLGDLFAASVYKDELNSNKAVKDVVSNLSSGFSLKKVLQTSHVAQKFDPSKECDKDDLLCKIIKVSDKFNEKATLDMIVLNGFNTTDKSSDGNAISCSADIGIKDTQKIIPDINATNFPKISTLDYEAKLTEDKKRIRVEIKRL